MESVLKLQNQQTKQFCTIIFAFFIYYILKILCLLLLDFSCCFYQTRYPPFFATLDVLSVDALSDNLLFEEEVKVGLEY